MKNIEVKKIEPESTGCGCNDQSSKVSMQPLQTLSIPMAGGNAAG